MLTDEWPSCSGHSGSAEDAGVAWTALVDQLAATGFAGLLPSILFISIPAAFIWLDRRGVLGRVKPVPKTGRRRWLIPVALMVAVLILLLFAP